MKKILFVINSLKHGGGAEKIVADIGTKLYEKGYDVNYLTFYDDKKIRLNDFKGKYFSTYWNSKIKVGFLKKILNLFLKAYFIKRISKQNNIDIIISSMEDSDIPNIFSKILFFNKSKIVVWVHNSKKYLYFLSKIFYRFADKIITIVNEEEQNLINNFGVKKENIITIYNSSNFDNINLLSNEDLGEYKKIFDNKKLTFINIGRLTQQKNQEFLIKVFKDFNKKYKDTQLLILGDGELRKKLEKLIGENKNIFLLGIQKNPYKFLKNADYFVFTSKWEGMPIVLIESLACNLPIISSDCSTGPAEVLRINGNFDKVDKLSIENFGILYSEGNEKYFFESLEKSYLEKKLHKKFKKNIKEKSSKFDIKNNIVNWDNFLKSL